jgi:iron complex outermembrane recepter protein
VPDRLRLTLGTRFEHNNYACSDHQPNVRLAWFASPEHTFWTSVSRAVRTPSRLDRDLFIPPQPPFVAAGGSTFESEELIAYELGWRGGFVGRTSISLTGFLHDYDGLRTLEQPMPLSFQNGLDARTYGAEFFFRHELNEAVNWSLGYTLLKRDFTLKPWSRDFNAGKVEEADPEHQVHLRGSFDLSRTWELDFGLRYVSPVPTLAARVQTDVPAYTELDARIGWLPRPDLEFSLVGTSLLDRAHPEGGAVTSRREIERSVHARMIWRF